MAKTDPEYVADIVSDLLKEEKAVYDPSEVRPKIKKALEGCNKANTLEGFEACLMTYTEDFGTKFRGSGVMPAREIFFKSIDEAAKIYDLYYRDHIL